MLLPITNTNFLARQDGSEVARDRSQISPVKTLYRSGGPMRGSWGGVDAASSLVLDGHEVPGGLAGQSSHRSGTSESEST